ncbi:MAG TPA: ABC transporter permease [Candidatus Methylomirabilis sp.]|nr:ABC transporter permease [Candidatus Methylomirabilis sp.]
MMARPVARFGAARESIVSGVTIVALVGVWLVVTMVFRVSPLILPSPKAMTDELGTLLSVGYAGKPLYLHVGKSLFRSFTGLVAGIALAVPIGLFMGYSRTVNAALVPIFGFFRPIPPIAFIPLMILWFGIGELSKILLIFAASFNYTVLNSAAGMRAVPEQLIRKGQNLGLTRWQLFSGVMLPAAMPHVFTGIKISTAVSWAIVVAAELIAAQEGLGFIIQDAGTFFRITDVFVGIIIVGLIGVTLEIVISLIERRTLHWQGK